MITAPIEDINTEKIKQLAKELKDLVREIQFSEYRQSVFDARSDRYHQLKSLVTCENCKYRVIINHVNGTFRCSKKDQHYRNTRICGDGDFELKPGKPTFQLF